MTLSRPIPLAGGGEELLERERASAMPQAVIAAPSPQRRRQRPVATAPLAALQRWFLTVITDHRSVAHGLQRAARTVPGAVVTDGAGLHAAGCLEVYHHAYHARLVECLADDFPCVQAVCGDEVFATLARGYIAAHPSRHPNLNGYGAGFPPWLRSLRRPLVHRALLADLAALEWALVDVLHAQAAPVLDATALAAIPVERWSGLRLRPSATVRLLTTAHPVNALYQSWRADDALVIPPPRTATVAVYRVGFALWRMDCAPITAALLRDLFAGRPLGTALARCAARADADADLVPRVMEWFRAWVAEGFFAAIE